MYTDVYVDVLFLINLSMDAISLYLTARLCSARFTIKRIVISSLVGALYSVLSVFCRFLPLIEIFLIIVVSFLMIVLAFDFSSFQEGVKYTVVFYIASSVIGGIISSLYTLMMQVFDTKTLEAQNNVSLSMLAVVALLSIPLSMILTRLHGSGNMPKTTDLTIRVLGKSIKRIGMIDSGNLLVEPLSNKSVIVIGATEMKGILSDRFIDMALRGDISVSSLLPHRERTVFRIIPASSICGEGYLCAVNTEGVSIRYKKNRKYVELERDAVLALSRDLNGECIVPASII